MCNKSVFVHINIFYLLTWRLCISLVAFLIGSYMSRYHTITDVYTTALLLTKPSSDDDSGFRHGFRSEASLPLTHSAPAVSHNTT